jgi:hypothetical protein
MYSWHIHTYAQKMFCSRVQVFVRKSAPLPFMEIKMAISAISLLFVAYCWYKVGISMYQNFVA